MKLHFGSWQPIKPHCRDANKNCPFLWVRVGGGGVGRDGCNFGATQGVQVQRGGEGIFYDWSQKN